VRAPHLSRQATFLGQRQPERTLGYPGRPRLIALALLLAGLAAGCGGGGRGTTTTSLTGSQTVRPPQVQAAHRPNIVFVLTDDLSLNLLRFMPHVRQMQRDGLTFQDYFVSDSLCCPSRASIFTGNFPHDTGV